MARLTKATHLVRDLPVTLQMLRRAELTVPQALAVLEETTELPAATCAAVEAKAYPQIVGMTPGDTRRAVKRIVVTVDAQASEARRQVKARARRVWHSPRPDGRALMAGELSAEHAGRFDRVLTALATTLYGGAGGGDPRRLDQQPADLRSGRLIALEDAILRPTEPDWTPSVLELELLAMVTRRTPIENRVETAHDPSQHLTDFITLRDDRCVGPGCSLPARLCDLEHRLPHPTGPTSADNLGPASRRCHNAKTHGGWTLQPHPDGSVTWTNPLGRTFTRPPRTTPTDLSTLRLPPRRTPGVETTRTPTGGDSDKDGDRPGDDSNPWAA